VRCTVVLLLLSVAPFAAADPPRPFLLHLPGVSGESVVDHTFVEGLKRARLDASIEIYDWTENDRGVPALQAYERNQKEAQKIADKVTAHLRAAPGVTIYLTSHSGGAGLAAWALEKLPADVKVKRALFLAPALSPTYDLSKALSHVADHAYAFWSGEDQLVLSAGTRVFGTIDGEYVDAAGFVGFSEPARADDKQYKKLLQFPYDRAWARYFHMGDHIGPMSTAFAQNVLAPLIESGKTPTTQPTTRP
jgi:hypothetical protein